MKLLQSIQKIIQKAAAGKPETQNGADPPPAACSSWGECPEAIPVMAPILRLHGGSGVSF